jgi:hypothetical protein
MNQEQELLFDRTECAVEWIQNVKAYCKYHLIDIGSHLTTDDVEPLLGVVKRNKHLVESEDSS